ncbi:hypothetical protein SUGI_0327030 [Cryptomeria japonica]|uniref:axial regulator YABBY 5 n=1 Tax=Cryptomeria japonica TaxID=3369 RepID=UPI002408F199|nr:axial regulator YABBY 5 [Cryptomeria japonica]XP_057829081.1 axial regulator YABBY 5 [Cryptomeria japonica]GLJ18444.1 hypothetical protein SUGI_0327030 [Cryptomeria japonica]
MSSCIDFASEHLCYVHCNFCSTILAVNVPSNSLYNMVTVRCGHCSHLLSVNMGATVPLESEQKRNDSCKDVPSSSSGSGNTVKSYVGVQATNTISGAPPEKRQRIPSAYNRFIKEEIQRIKANNPDIRHKDAFSAAAKNWAHFPDIHFGLSIEKSKQATSRKEDNEVIMADSLCSINDGRMRADLY